MSISFIDVEEKHCDLIFKWANDPIVRVNSFNSNPISYEEHRKWFFSKLKSKESIFLICKIDGISIGQIRIDKKPKIGEINYSIEKTHRNKGYGTKILSKIKEIVKLRDQSIKKIIGLTKPRNFGSQKAFENAGFTKIVKEDIFLFYLEI